MKTPLIDTQGLLVEAEPGYLKVRHSANVTHILGEFLITKDGLSWGSDKIIVERKTELDGKPVKPYLIYHV